MGRLRPASCANGKLLRIEILVLDKVSDVRGDLLDSVVRAGHRLAESLVDGNDASPHGVDDIFVPEILPLVARDVAFNLGAGPFDGHLHDAGRLHLAAVRGHAGVGPAIGHHSVRDELHGPQLLVAVLNDGGPPLQHGGSIVVAVVERRQRHGETVDFGGLDAHGKPVGAQLHQPARYVAVQVARRRLIAVRRVDGDVPDHG